MRRKKKIKIAKIGNGFTLVEMMITVALFSIVMVVGVGAVLNVNRVHKKTQDMRAVIDNLSFIMEDMARNLRLGSNYHCDYFYGSVNSPQDCSDELSIAFEHMEGNPSDSEDQIIYFIDGNEIKKQSHTEFGFQNLTPPEVKIDPDKSGFSVTGSSPNDLLQPRVIIRLSGVAEYKDVVSSFNLQTSVSQRLLDTK